MITTNEFAQQLINSIEELKERSRFLEGQSNLLLSYITSSPEKYSAFFEFVQFMAYSKELPENDAAQSVARQFVSMMKQQQSHEEQTAPSDKKYYQVSNIIQFPNLPSKD